MENSFGFIAGDEPSSNDDTDESPDEGSGASSISRKYGWRHTIEWVTSHTPGMNEDYIMAKPVLWFLSRAQYLYDVSQAEAHDARIRAQQKRWH